MVYAQYGKLFRQLRNQKHLGLSYFQKLGIPSANLSRFERGKSMMNFERVDSMLQEMNVSLAEYELMLNNFIPNFQEAFLEEVEDADFNDDFEKLKTLYDEAYESGYSLLALAVKARFEHLNPKEITIITSHLNKIERWGYFELSLTYFIMDSLQTEDIISILIILNDKSRNYFGLLKYRRRILQITYRSLFVLASRGEKELSFNILEQTNQRDRKMIDFYIETLHNLSVSVFVYCFEDKEKGRFEINTNLDLMSTLGTPQLKKFYKRRLKETLGL